FGSAGRISARSYRYGSACTAREEPLSRAASSRGTHHDTHALRTVCHSGLLDATRAVTRRDRHRPFTRVRGEVAAVSGCRGAHADHLSRELARIAVRALFLDRGTR